ncbi:hypothetical protein [Tenacibaculum salmonis]|uniref:hypothetical protein n=1 Tax=Tenacibaculum sp. P3-BQ1 TaxID=3232310 RepID=UPI0034DDF582
MARLTAQESDRKKSEGKQLYVAGFALSNISSIINIGLKTLGNWRKENKWDEEKELNSIKPSSIRRLTLKQALAIEKGEPLPYKTNDIINTVAAFDRITDSKKIAVYSMESIDNFSNFMLELAATAKPKKREEIIELTKNIRPYFDQFITKLIQDD